MGNPVIWFVVGIVTGVIATLGVMRSLRTTPRPASKPVVPTASLVTPTASLVTPSLPNEDELASLRQNLRVKVGHVEEKIDDLIEEERKLAPSAGLAQLMKNA